MIRALTLAIAAAATNSADAIRHFQLHLAAPEWDSGSSYDCHLPGTATNDEHFEEDEEVFVHARDPYTRIDILPSSRRVRVEIDGVTVADSTNASFLFETGLPTRYYLPKTDVRMDLTSPTDLETACPYKGTARYWNVTLDGTTHENILWGYDSPLPESQKIGGLVAFYNEKGDTYIDEQLQDRPKTKFS